MTVVQMQSDIAARAVLAAARKAGFLVELNSRKSGLRIIALGQPHPRHPMRLSRYKAEIVAILAAT